MQDPVLPAPPKAFSTLEEAAAWLGLSEWEFRAEVRRYPLLLHHQTIGKSHKWAAADLACYRHLRSAGRCGPANEDPKKKS